jgi:glutaredoxin
LEKAWLSEQGIDFEDRDVTEDPDAMNELQEMGYFSTPVTVIGDDVVVGFDKGKLQTLLDLKQ